MKGSYKRTIYSCFIGYVVQAVVVNFLPLLFVTLEKDYGITVSQISLLITVNFVIQLSVDLLSAAVIDRIGYRVAMNIAHILAATGLVLLAFYRILWIRLSVYLFRSRFTLWAAVCLRL